MSPRYCYAAVWLPKDRLEVHRFRMRCERDAWAERDVKKEFSLRFALTAHDSRWSRAVYARLAGALWEGDVTVLEVGRCRR